MPTVGTLSPLGIHRSPYLALSRSFSTARDFKIRSQGIVEKEEDVARIIDDIIQPRLSQSGRHNSSGSSSNGGSSSRTGAGNAGGSGSAGTRGSPGGRVGGRKTSGGTSNSSAQCQPATVSCPKCNSQFSTRGNLNRHLRTAHEGHRVFCDVPGCNQSFSQAADLKRHKKRIHRLGVKSGQH